MNRPDGSNTAAAATNTAGTRREALVMAHNQLRFNLVDGVHRHADDNQQGGTTEEKVHTQAVEQEAREMRVDEVTDEREPLQLDAGDHDLGNNRKNREVETTDHGDLGQNLV